MVATGNVGLAWLLVCLAGLATTLGACIVWCVSLAQPKLLAGSLGFAAGVMLYVSFAEIFLRKSVAAFESLAPEDPAAAYRWSTLCFFGGMLIVLVLDKLVHALAHWNDRRLGRAGGHHGGVGPSVSTANLLSHEDPERRSGWRRRRRPRADDGSPATKPPLPAVMEMRSSSGGGFAGAGGETAAATAGAAAAAEAAAAAGDGEQAQPAFDVEAGGGQDTDVDSARAQRPGGSASACSEGSSTPPRELSAPGPGLPELCDSVVGDIVAATSPSVVEADPGEPPPTPGGGTSRTPPAVVEIMEADHHAFMLKKMGVLTAIAIFIHNFPEGLATFVGALADTKIGVGLAVAIAMHNIPEGICVAMPIYYATGSKWKGFWWAFLSGASEPLGALVGYLALSGSNTDLSFAIVFGLVAGMMVYISVKELVPTALRYDPQDSVASTCVVAGMVVMAASLLLFTL